MTAGDLGTGAERGFGRRQMRHAQREEPGGTRKTGAPPPIASGLR